MTKKFVFILSILILFWGATKSADAWLVNGGFETGDLTGWDYGGQVGVQTDIVFDGNFAAWIGTVDFNGDEINDFTNENGTEGYTNNWISQTIDVTGMDKLELWYNFYTWDYSGWDEPGFEIVINGQPVLSIYASDIDTGNNTLDSTGWQLFSYDLSNYSESTLELTIYAGNTGDEFVQSWVYIDNPTSSPVPEPATMSLLGIGLLGTAFIIRRKAKK